MKLPFLLLLALALAGCATDAGPNSTNTAPAAPPKSVSVTPDAELAAEIRNETLRAWNGYKKYAWSHDVLHPLAKGHSDWYAEPLAISLIDAYSTLKLMGFDEEAAQVETFVKDTMNLDRDSDVETFEVNIRILGGLMSMYEMTRDTGILRRAREFGDRMMPAFDTPSGLPTFAVNLKTGATRGMSINSAEAGSYLIEMGILSYYTGDPRYYQAAKRSTKVCFDGRSELGLVGQQLDVERGVYTDSVGHIGACIDSYYEYLPKAYELFGDPELKAMWDVHLAGIQEHIPTEDGDKLWYGYVNRFTGEKTWSRVTLWDAFLPGLLAYSGEIGAAKRSQRTWDWLWRKYGLEPTAYNWERDSVLDGAYDLNPEIIESAYYLSRITGEPEWQEMVRHYWSSYRQHCRNDVAFHKIRDVRTMEPQDEMATFLFAESLKYFYLTFSPEEEWQLENVVFSTEAHPFKKSSFQRELAAERLGFSL